MEAKVPEIKVGVYEFVAHNKVEFVKALRDSAGDDRYDRLADFLGCNLDEDPFGFWINVNVRYYRAGYVETLSQGREKYAGAIDYYMKHYPNATRRAISYVAKSGEYFYEKYGSERVWKEFEDLRSINGITLDDVFNLEDDEDAKVIVMAGSELKNRIAWQIVHNWMDDLCEWEQLLEDEVAAVCGDE